MRMDKFEKVSTHEILELIPYSKNVVLMHVSYFLIRATVLNRVNILDTMPRAHKSI